MAEDVVIAPAIPGTASLWHGRGRQVLATGAARLVMMAGIAGYLAWRGLAEARPGTPMYSPILDLAVPLTFAAMAVWLAARTMLTVFHFAFADAPVLRLAPAGLLAPADVPGIIPWAAITNAKVFRRSGTAALLIDLEPGSRVRTRIWPFWPAGTITLWVSDPDAACAAIHAHPNYRGAQADAA